jgi:predicted permease
MTSATDRATSSGARWVERAATVFYRALLLCYPTFVRDALIDDAATLFGEACRADLMRAGAKPVIRRFAAAIFTVPADGWSERRRNRRTRAAADATDPAVPSRPLGPAGPALWADVRHGMRSLRSRPGLSAAIIATLALGIGASTAVFSVIDATLLRPLPYIHAGRVAWLQVSSESGRPTDPLLSWARAWTADSSTVERIEAIRSRSVLLTGAGSATRERLAEITAGYFSATRTRPVVGRLLLTEDSLPSAPAVVIISAGLWRERFGERVDALGTTLLIDRQPHQIVGVVPDIRSDIPGLQFRLATPVSDAGPNETPIRVVAWLKPGTSLDAANGEIRAVPAAVREGHQMRPILSVPRNIFWTIPTFRTTEIGVAVAGLLLLIIAGVNVANLLLAAGQARAADLSLRRALGASTFRLLRLLLVETTTLALAGALLGLGLAWTAVRSFAALEAGPQLQSALDGIRIDPLVTGYAVAAALITAAVFGLAPAIRGARATDLRSDGRGFSHLGRGPSVLVAVETALAAVLLLCGGIVCHAFLAMHFADRGFDADRVLSVRIALPRDKYPTPAEQTAFFAALVDEASRLPSVERASIGYGATPPSDFFDNGELRRAGSNASPTRLNFAMSFVTRGYFDLMGIPLLQGSELPPANASLAPGTATPTVISRSLAESVWPDGGAVGAVFEITTSRRASRYQVAGIAGDVSGWGLLSPNCRNCNMQLYLPLPEQRQYTNLLLRVREHAALPIAEMQAAVARLDPDVPSDDELGTAEEGLAHFIGQPRFTAVLLSAFALLAVALVAVGLSAVVSHAVARRTREMGIRMALGADTGRVRGLVILQGLRPALAGLAAGMAAALGVTRLMQASLYGLSAADPITVIGVPVILVTIAIVALLIPAIRATRVDPVRALRAD